MTFRSHFYPYNLVFKAICLFYYVLTLGQVHEMFMPEPPTYIKFNFPGLNEFLGWSGPNQILEVTRNYLRTMTDFIVVYVVGFTALVLNRRVPHIYRFHVLQVRAGERTPPGAEGAAAGVQGGAELPLRAPSARGRSIGPSATRGGAFSGPLHPPCMYVCPAPARRGD